MDRGANTTTEEVLKAIREVGPGRQMVMADLFKGLLVTR
ncbi:hypothetical protein USDA257_c25370 [Sinorhizobium fredii USDA 257]|uniref:Uncharacterized protein n=1 Tax=Sinorhizobium fredii (strain USDA 257) TaxID=1185652 RepID=I3X5F7_SINF2|nr:hypothetical protein USDA257_c25370 [Sinorhizobium fredii USDA 257]